MLNYRQVACRSETVGPSTASLHQRQDGGLDVQRQVWPRGDDTGKVGVRNGVFV
jgi:hypothetical protein